MTKKKEIDFGKWRIITTKVSSETIEIKFINKSTGSYVIVDNVNDDVEIYGEDGELRYIR